MSKNPIITVLVASAILLFRPSPVMSQSQISDFIFPPGKNMFAERKLTDPSLDSSRIGEVVVIPYLIHVDHTTRKLEVVCYALDKPTVQVEVRSVQIPVLQAAGRGQCKHGEASEHGLSRRRILSHVQSKAVVGDQECLHGPVLPVLLSPDRPTVLKFNKGLER